MAALATDPTPMTMVQKITGAMSILISATKPVPMGARAFPTSGAISPRAAPSTTPAITDRYSRWVPERYHGVADAERAASEVWAMSGSSQLEGDGVPGGPIPS